MGCGKTALSRLLIEGGLKLLDSSPERSNLLSQFASILRLTQVSQGFLDAAHETVHFLQRLTAITGTLGLKHTALGAERAKCLLPFSNVDNQILFLALQCNGCLLRSPLSGGKICRRSRELVEL